MPRKLWVKGQSGNPAGRPKGSKNRITDLTKVFLEAFYADLPGNPGGKAFLIRRRSE